MDPDPDPGPRTPGQAKAKAKANNQPASWLFIRSNWPPCPCACAARQQLDSGDLATEFERRRGGRAAEVNLLIS